MISGIKSGQGQNTKLPFFPEGGFLTIYNKLLVWNDSSRQAEFRTKIRFSIGLLCEKIQDVHIRPFQAFLLVDDSFNSDVIPEFTYDFQQHPQYTMKQCTCEELAMPGYYKQRCLVHMIDFQRKCDTVHIEFGDNKKRRRIDIVETAVSLTPSRPIIEWIGAQPSDLSSNIMVPKI